jgi:hypothetical protein
MLSRRNFLKLAGLGSIALTAGYSAGKIIQNNKSEYFIVHGFLPADENILLNLISSFSSKVKSNSQPIIIADTKIGEVVYRLHNQNIKSNFYKDGKVIYRVKKLNNNLDADIIVGDGISSVYSPDDFNFSFFNLRSQLKNKKADLLFTAEFKNENIFSSILNTNKKEFVIENEKGIVERISIDKNYKNISVDGVYGKTVLSIENGIALVNSSPCKNGICKHTYASETGSIIACAPNKVLVKVV